eukprot:6417616-Amphidinium_carterae.1
MHQAYQRARSFIESRLCVVAASLLLVGTSSPKARYCVGIALWCETPVATHHTYTLAPTTSAGLSSNLLNLHHTTPCLYSLDDTPIYCPDLSSASAELHAIE